VEDGLNAILTKIKPKNLASDEKKKRYQSIEDSIRKIVPTTTGGNKD